MVRNHDSHGEQSPTRKTKAMYIEHYSYVCLLDTHLYHEKKATLIMILIVTYDLESRNVISM